MEKQVLQPLKNLGFVVGSGLVSLLVTLLVSLLGSPRLSWVLLGYFSGGSRKHWATNTFGEGGHEMLSGGGS